MYQKLVNQIFPYLSQNILNEIKKKYIEDSNVFKKICEIRIRNGINLVIKLFDVDIVFKYIVIKEDIEKILEKISNYSIYSVQEELNNGYITIKGGHRIGICGSVVMENNEIKNIKNISSINIRIAREVVDLSNSLVNYLYNNSFESTLLVSPPNCGKTTLLRDMIRNISNNGQTVCVIDERSEIACTLNGFMQMNLGIRSDVITNVPKYIGIKLGIRSMGPNVIAVDEIGSKKDIEAIKDGLVSGVRFIATAHGNSLENIKKSNLLELLNIEIFKYIIFLKKEKLPCVIDKIYELHNNEYILRR